MGKGWKVCFSVYLGYCFAAIALAILIIGSLAYIEVLNALAPQLDTTEFKNLAFLLGIYIPLISFSTGFTFAWLLAPKLKEQLKGNDKERDSPPGFGQLQEAESRKEF